MTSALTAILAELVMKVSATKWTELLRNHAHFPAKLTGHLASLYDVCFFDAGSQGALGFSFIEFKNCESLLILPFKLERHKKKDESSLASISPWILNEARLDSLFFQYWRSAFAHNFLKTQNKGRILLKRGEGYYSLRAHEDDKSKNFYSVALEHHETIKIFKMISPSKPMARNVQMLLYLNSCEDFIHFHKFISLYTYQSHGKKDFELPIAISNTTPQEGRDSLLRYMETLLSQTFQSLTKNDIGLQKHWASVLFTTQQMGRITAEFHKCMAQAQGEDYQVLLPEIISNETNSKKSDFQLKQKFEERLSSFWDDFLKKNVKDVENDEAVSFFKKALENYLSSKESAFVLALHGHLSLESFHVEKEMIVLDHFTEENETTFSKFYCLYDVACLLVDLKFVWHNLDLSVNDNDSLHSSLYNYHSLMMNFLKTYISFLKEYSKTFAILPPTEKDFAHSLNAYLIYFCLKRFHDMKVNFNSNQSPFQFLKELLYQNHTNDIFGF